MPDPLSWVIIAIALLFSFFFSSVETAISCCNRYKMNVLADKNSKSAKLVLKCLDKYDLTLTTAIIGNNICSIVISSISAVLFYKYFSAIGLENLASLFNTIIMTVVVYIFGDTLPKTIGKAIPDTLSLMFIYPCYFFLILFYPISLLFALLMKLIEKVFKIKKEPTITEDDLIDSVDQADEEEIPEEAGDIIQNAIEFSDINVKEVLTSKEKMYAINISNITREKLNEILLSTSYSRIPLYREDKDNIIGILHVKTYLSKYALNHNITYKSALYKPYEVSPNIMIDDLFKGFKKHHTHIAIVKNNNKETIGMVTMEDVLEEIVDDIGETNRGNK